MNDLSALARQHLRSPSTRFPPYRFSPMFRRALAQCGYGLDPLHGEEVLAIVNHSQTREEFMGVIVTSFGVLARFGSERVHVPFDALRGARLHEGLFTTVVELETASGDMELPVLRDAAAVADFLSAAAGHRPRKVRAPARHCPSRQDPACVASFLSSLEEGDDPRIAAAARRAASQLEQGADPAAVRDQIARLEILRLLRTQGRPMCDGQFISPLRPVDLRAVAHRLLPPPQTEPAALIPDPEKVKDQVQTALLEKAMGAAVSKAFGVDLEELLEDDEVTARRFAIEDGPSITRFVGTVGEADSPWGMLKSLATKALGDSGKSTALGSFRIEAQTGRRWRDLASLDPNATFTLLEALEQHEIEALLAE